MLDTQDAGSYIGADVIDADGDRIGTVGQIYLDESGAPAFASVRTGFFGTSESFVPIDRADATDEGIRVPYQKGVVKDAPRIDIDGNLEQDDADELYRYYGAQDGSDAGAGATRTGDATATGGARDLSDATATAAGGVDDPTASTTAAAGGTDGYDTSGPTTDDAMTRSEERLRVGTEKVQTGRVRLRKYVVTEQQTVTVPVSHEEVRLEREPITDANVGDATAGPDISEEEHEIVLTEERPVVATETVPVERIRLSKDTVTEDREVTGDVRKEQVEYDDGTGTTAAAGAVDDGATDAAAADTAARGGDADRV